MTGYYWALEDVDERDNDWLLVFVELDETICYGKTIFEKEHFSKFIKAEIERIKPNE